jgi:NADH dehydrogenase FAD-containing subunit
MIVIVGGGYAGTEVAQLVEKKCPKEKLILIHPMDYSYHSLGSVRTAANPSFSDHVLVPLDKLFKQPQNKIIKAKVTAIHANNVELDRIVDLDGVASQQIHFDYAVLAMGSSYSIPFKCEEESTIQAKKLLNEFSEKIKLSNKIVIAGSGPVALVNFKN